MYRTEEYGLFLSYVTMPFGKEGEFFKYEIENLFECYKKSVLENLTSNPEPPNAATIKFKEFLYKPKAYCLFGIFDLAIFSLVDDFGFAIRTFHPFNSIIQERLFEDRENGKTDYNGDNYSYHVISGLVPDMRYLDDSEGSIIEKAQATFLAKGNEKLPFIGITSFKINSAFLLGGGGDLVHLILAKLKDLLSEPDGIEGNFNFLILHSFSWHEITIVFFSNNYSKISSKILAVRNLVFEDLHGVDEEICKKVFDSSLIAEFLQKYGEKESPEKYKRLHLFVHTNTIFGYALDFITNAKEYDPIIPSFDGQRLFSKFSVKPGHLAYFYETLNKKIGKIDGFEIYKSTLTSGRSDYGMEIKGDLILRFRQLKNLLKDNQLFKHLTNINTVLEFDPGLQEDYCSKISSEDYYFFSENLSKFSFSLKTISEIGDYLRRLRVSKIVTEKILNMFIVFNDGIHDPILFGYYLELKPFLLEVIQILKKFTNKLNKPVGDVISQLNDISQLFEYGYKNRFSQSHLMSEITDYNIEFNGGIQQLLSAYDGAYKSLTGFFGEKAPGKSIAYAAGNTNTVSHTLGVELNYFHLYQPEFFATAATHEAANFYLRRDRAEDDALNYIRELLAKLYASKAPQIEKSTLAYFFQDYVTLHLTFNNNFGLFFYWHWCSFFQNSVVYYQDGRIYQKFFDRFIYRMYLVGKCVGDLTCFENKIAPPFNMLDESCYKSWELSLNKAQKDIPLYRKKHFVLIDEIIGVAKGLLLVDFFNTSSQDKIESCIDKIEKIDTDSILDIFRIHRNRGSKNVNLRYESIKLEVGRIARFYFLDKISKEVIDSFRKGELFDFESIRSLPFTESIEETPFLYHTIFYAYLKLLYELNDGIGDILKRKRGEGTISQIGNRSNLFEAIPKLKIDPFGGFFTTDLEVRRRYYQYRTLFLKSLWSISLKNKVRLIHAQKPNED